MNPAGVLQHFPTTQFRWKWAAGYLGGRLSRDFCSLSDGILHVVHGHEVSSSAVMSLSLCESCCFGYAGPQGEELRLGSRATSFSRQLWDLRNWQRVDVSSFGGYHDAMR